GSGQPATLGGAIPIHTESNSTQKPGPEFDDASILGQLGGQNPTILGVPKRGTPEWLNPWPEAWGRPTNPKWRLPESGKWSGQHGHSYFIPDDPVSLGLEPGEVVPFRQGRADFSWWAEYEFTSEEPLMGNRNTEQNTMHQETAKYFNRIGKPHPDGGTGNWTG